MIQQVAFTCYPVKDMARARAFYEGVLGLKPDTEPTEGEGGTWIEYTNGDDTFSLGQMEGFNPTSDGASVAFEVDDFLAAVKNLEDNGIAFKMGPMETPVCHMAMFLDTEGNSLMIHKRK